MRICPKKEWINILTENETIIYETNEDPIKNKECIDKWRVYSKSQTFTEE